MGPGGVACRPWEVVLDSLLNTVSQEREELVGKQKELSLLEQELMDEELVLSTLQGGVDRFEERYLRRVGQRYAEMDDIKARVLEMAARFHPENPETHDQARMAREQARQSQAESHFDREPGPVEPASDEASFEPTEELKKLFRDVAKKIHPDLTTEPEERERRNRWMTRLNEAYTASDATAIREVLKEWQVRQTPEDRDQVRQQLTRVLKQIGQVRHRLHQIKKDKERIAQSDMARLKRFVEEGEAEGRDVLADMAREVEENIQSLKTRVAQLARDCALM